MKRLIVVVLLIAVAGIAGIVRSRTRAGSTLSNLSQSLAGDSPSTGQEREEIRKSFELTPGANVRVSGINGSINIETSDSALAELFIERTGKSRESLQRRTVTVESSSSSLEIRGKNGDVGLIARLFGSSPTERVTLKLPRRISLITEGINGGVKIDAVDGPIEVSGINGKVEIAETSSVLQLHGINGNISVGLKEIYQNGISLHGVNGNIDFIVAPGLSAEFQAHGMNGNIISELPDFVLEKSRHGSISAHLGNGGNEITANGINGNILVSRSVVAGNSATSSSAR